MDFTFLSGRGEPKSGAVKIFLLQSLCLCILPSLIHTLTVEKCPQCNSLISENGGEEMEEKDL